MNRRQLFTQGLPLLAGAVTGIAQSPAPAGAATHSLKGMTTNDLASANIVNADWMKIGWSAGAWDYPGTLNAPWSLHLYENVPNATDVQEVVAHPNYDGWWQVGYNEPDHNNITPQQYANLIITQISIVLSKDPYAKFSATCGTWAHPLYQENSWWAQMWALLPQWVKNKIKAFHTHFYPTYSGSPWGYPDEQILTRAPLRNYVKAVREFMDGYSPALAKKELWLAEVGLAKIPYVMSHLAQANYYPAEVQRVCDQYVDRWAWFKLSDITGENGPGPSNYITLTTGNEAALTGAGLTFRDL